MQGLWRPAISLGSLPALVIGLIVLNRGADLDPMAFLVVPLAVLVPLSPLLFAAMYPAGRYLAGLRDGGLVFDVVEDRITWFGERRITLATPRGPLEVYGEGGRHPRLSVRYPGHRDHQRVSIWRPRRAGRDDATDLAGAGLEPPPEPTPAEQFAAYKAWLVPDENTIRWGPACALLLGLPALALAIGWEIGRPDPIAPAEPLAWLAIGLVTLTGTLWLILGAAWTLQQFSHLVDTMGRRAAAAGILVGVGTGVATAAATWTGVVLLADGPLPVDLVAAGVLGTTAGLLGLMPLAAQWVPTRFALTVGALTSVFASIWFPHPLAMVLVGAMVLLVLFQAWTPAPPTGPDGPAPG